MRKPPERIRGRSALSIAGARRGVAPRRARPLRRVLGSRDAEAPRRARRRSRREANGGGGEDRRASRQGRDRARWKLDEGGGRIREIAGRFTRSALARRNRARGIPRRREAGRGKALDLRASGACAAVDRGSAEPQGDALEFGGRGVRPSDPMDPLSLRNGRRPDAGGGSLRGPPHASLAALRGVDAGRVAGAVLRAHETRPRRSRSGRAPRDRARRGGASGRAGRRTARRGRRARLDRREPARVPRGARRLL